MTAIIFIIFMFQINIYIICNSMGLTIGLLKIIILLIHKNKFLGLIVYMQKNFLHLNYDEYETSIIVHAKQLCIYFICPFLVLCQSTVLCYGIRPIICKYKHHYFKRCIIFNIITVYTRT